MKNCCICSRKIGKFEDQYKIKENDNNICCYQCAPYFRNFENATPENYTFKKNQLIERIENNHTTILPEIIAYTYECIKEKDSTSSEVNMQKKICPVCKCNINPNSTCLICGYVDQRNNNLTQNEKVNLINTKNLQIAKNPMFEYSVEVVSDSAILGHFLADDINTVLMEYALNGWKLHTAFSNEVGKNSIAGINATINQTVLIFERCIKSKNH